MDRRDFFKKSVLTGAAVSLPAGALQAVDSPPAGTRRIDSGAPAILTGYTADDHRRRLENIGVCTQKIRKCMRKHLITNYLPGQCCYNLGEYPCRKPWEIGEYDEQELDRLKEHGIQLVHIFDDWNDSLRLFGGDKYSATNPAGIRRFIEMCHRRGMKVLVYISTGFLQYTDPDFCQEWATKGSILTLGYWQMARCSPASPGWRAYLLPRVTRILDEYGFDGFYVDTGYITNAARAKMPDDAPLKKPAEDEVAAFEETPEFDGALADILALIYAEVKRRGGILKLHIDGVLAPKAANLPVYDYLWVGEGVTNADTLREKTKNHQPYVVPCIDMTYTSIEDDDDPYLHAIPYLQFPLLQAGRPWTGERASIPGVEYPLGDNDWWRNRCKQIAEFLKTHPDGPYTYGGWDSVPGRPETRLTNALWLKRYIPLAEDGTWVFLEIADSQLLAKPLPPECVASAFANRDLHLVLANYGTTSVVIETVDNYVALDPSSASLNKIWNLPPRSLLILQRDRSV